MTFQPIGTDHLTPTIATATQQLDRQAAIINEIRELHRPIDYFDSEIGYEWTCNHCDTPYPCETRRIVEAVKL